MKKIILCGAAVFSFTAIMAQNPYVGISVGYGLPLPGEPIGTNSTTESNGNKTTENVYGTIGTGLGINLLPGYNVSEHFGVELGINYFMGSKVDMSKTTTPFGSATVTVHSTQLRLTPSLVFRTGNEGLYGYAKAGVVIPMTGTTFAKVDDTGAAGPGTASVVETETKGAFSYGFSGAAGVNYSLNDRMSLFAEANAVQLRINSKSTTVTSYEMSGTDVLANLTTYQKETTYVDELNSSSNNSNYNSSYSTGTAKDDLRTRRNFGALFLNIGFRMNF